MQSNERYKMMRLIITSNTGAELRRKKGSTFHFRVYLNSRLAEMPIEVLDLSVRAYNCLRRAGIGTIEDLCTEFPNSSDLKRVRNCGDTCVVEIMDKLFAYHYAQLKPERREKYLKEIVELNKAS